MTTRPHYAGLNTAKFARALEGHAVLISYADVVRRPGVWANEILPRLEAGLYVEPILDSGAFTELTTPGFHVDVEAFAAFVREHGHLFDQIITLDDIQGDLATTWRNTQRLEELTGGREFIPVFHGREPFEVLHHYCQRFGRVALGFARDLGRIAKDQGEGHDPESWLRQALEIVESYGCHVHGLGMTRYALKLGHGRLDTTDSTTWIAEFCALRSAKWVEGGPALSLLEGLADAALAKLAILSLTGSGGDDETEELVVGSRGQARTSLRRFAGSELRAHVAELRVSC